MFTARNAVVLALTQVGVIVAGTMAAAVSSKIWIAQGIESPFASFFLLNYGMLLFVFPLGWISTAMAIRQKEWVSDDIKHLTFLVGMALLLTLIIFELYAVLNPWFSCFHVGFGARGDLNE